MRIGTEYNPKVLFDGIIIICSSISLVVSGQKKKKPGLLNLGSYELKWMDGFSFCRFMSSFMFFWHYWYVPQNICGNPDPIGKGLPEN